MPIDFASFSNKIRLHASLMSAFWTLADAIGQLIERASHVDGVVGRRLRDGVVYAGRDCTRLRLWNIAGLDRRAYAAWCRRGLFSIDHNGQGPDSKEAANGPGHEKLMFPSRANSMMRQAAILLGLPIAIIGLVAAPLGFFLGHYQWLCAGIGIGLTVPAGLMTLLAAEWLSKTSPYGGLIAACAGTFVRLAIGFGGGVLLFFVCGQLFRADPISYWLWLLAAYLTTLTIEMAVLVHKQFQATTQQKARSV